MRHLAVAIVLLVASCAVTSAQPPSLTMLAPAIGRGYDIVTERVKAPFTEWTYYDGYVMEWNGQEYAVPDQLIETLTPKTLYDSQYLMVHTSEEFFRYYVKSTSIGLSLTYAGFTLSAAFSRTKGEIENTLKNNTRVLSTVNNIAMMFQLSLLSPYSPDMLHSRFHDSVNRLPAEYNEVAYKRFLQTWGTHYFTMVQYGAKVNFTSAFDRDLTVRRGSEWVNKQMSVSVGYAMFSVGVASSLATAENNVDSQFSQSSTMSKDVVGGSSAILERDGWNAWVTDAKSAPGLIVDRSKLAPITDLIFDPVRKQHLATQLVAYCNQDQE